MSNKMRMIGKGEFTKAYSDDTGKVYLKSVDHAKEVLALGLISESKHLPKINQSDIDNFDYVTDFTPPLSKIGGINNLSEKGKRQYRDCRQMVKSLECVLYNYQDVIDVANTYVTDCELRETIVEFVEVFCNYTQLVCFEFSPRNVSVTDDGEVLLLDCFFSKEQQNEIRKGTN